jgi:hypothetical protein
MNIETFITTYLGKSVDVDGNYGSQCVDLFRQYVKDVLGFAQPKPVVGAKDFWFGYDLDDNLNDNFKKIANTPEGVPQKGDIILWNKTTTNPYGHVAIFLEGDANSFTSLDQNWKGVQLVKKVSHSYVGVLGWLRPINIMTLKETVIDWDDEEGKRHTVDWYVREWFIEKTEKTEFQKELERLRKENDFLRRNNAILSNSVSDISGRNVALENQVQEQKNIADSIGLANESLVLEITGCELEIRELKSKLNSYLEKLTLGDFISWVGIKLGIKK